MKPLHRIVSAILALSLGVPAPVWALRDPQTREKKDSVLAGLEETLRSGGPDRLLQTARQAMAPIVSPIPSATGMEEAVRAVPLGNRVVVVEMGGTRIRAGLADNRSGELLGPVESRAIHFPEGIPKTDSRNAPVVLEQLNDLIDTVLRRYGAARPEVGAISFSSAGILDQQTGFIELQSNLPFTGMNLREEIRARWGGEALITNDVAAAALAEALYGTGQGGPVVVYLTISTGLDAGLYLREQKRVMDLRFGRLLAYDGQPITEYASGRAIKQRAAEAIARREPGWEEIVALAGGDAGAVDVPHVTDAWLGGNNPLASAILEDAVRVLGEGVVQATGQIEANGWLSGDRAVLWVYGGGIGEGLGDFFERRFQQAVAAALKHPDRKGQQSKIQVIRSVMDPDKRGLMGAAARSLAAAWLEDKPVAEWRRKVAIPQRVLAIEMGGTRLRMAIADRRTGGLVASVPDWSWQFLPDLPHNDPRNRPEILRQIRQHADRLADQEGLGSISEAGLVSIDSPGVIQTDPKASDYGWVELQYNLPFQGTNQLREIMTVLGFAAGRGLIENDMPAAIVAEAFYGGLQGRRLGFYLTASGGTNAAVFWQGSDDKARTLNLELAGYPVPGKGSGAKVQDFTSGPSLARMARERILAERTQGGPAGRAAGSWSSPPEAPPAAWRR